MTRGKIMWGSVALVAASVVAVVVAGSFLFLRRGPGPGGGEGQQTVEVENLWVQYTASFKLIYTSVSPPSTENLTLKDVPIENLYLSLPFPCIRPGQLRPILTSLNGLLIPENRFEEHTEFGVPIENFEISFTSGGGRPPPTFTPLGEENRWLSYSFCPLDNSGSAVVVISFPRVRLKVSNLYPGDNFTVTAWLRVPVENFEKLTLVSLLPISFYQYENEAWVDASLSPSYQVAGYAATVSMTYAGQELECFKTDFAWITDVIHLAKLSGVVTSSPPPSAAM